MKNIWLKFNVGDLVTIIDLEMVGRVVSWEDGVYTVDDIAHCEGAGTYLRHHLRKPTEDELMDYVFKESI